MRYDMNLKIIIFVSSKPRMMEKHDILYKPEEVRSRIIMGRGSVESARSYLLALLSSFSHVFAFIDKNLMMKSKAAFDIALELQQEGVPMRAIEASEQSKTMDSVMDICSWLMDKGADRDALLVAIGGGITTDMVGFAASIYKRGVRYVSVPTTLLSQVDAGLGGKTGVNFMQYKNMLGTVHQPFFTFIWPEFLKTLPRRDFLSGAAELLKTFMIEDESGQWYAKAVHLLQTYTASDGDWTLISEDDIADVIEAAAKVKAGIVSRDPFEKGERRKLNLGHTFAHAIENLARKKDADITHGEAVAMGLVLAATLARKLDSANRFDTSEGLASRIAADLTSCGICAESPFPVEEMADAMSKDKKAEGGKVHFVLPHEIGAVAVVDLSVDEVCRLFAQ